MYKEWWRILGYTYSEGVLTKFEDKMTFVSKIRDDIEETTTPIVGVHDIITFFNGDSQKQKAI